MATDYLMNFGREFVGKSTGVVMSALTVAGVTCMLLGEYIQPSKLIGWSKGGRY